MLILFSAFGAMLDRTRLSLAGRSRFSEILKFQYRSFGGLGLSLLCMLFMVLATVWVWWAATHPPTAHFFLNDPPAYLVRSDVQSDVEASEEVTDAAPTQRQEHASAPPGTPPPTQTVELISSRSPQMSFERVQSWLTRSLMDAYHIDFVNYEKQLETSRVLFREDTYELFLSQMNANLVPSVRKGRMILTLTPVSSVRLISQAQYEGRRLWLVEMKGLIYFDASLAKPEPPQLMVFKIVIEEVPASTTPYGVVISSISMTPA